jgi:two-component system nitrate/nitrite response regulator NarL
MIVDDHALFAQALAGFIKSLPDYTVVGEAHSAKTALQAAMTTRPDIILMDVGLPDGSGLDVMDRILEELPQTQVIFLTVHEDEETAFDALGRGAKGYLVKDIDTQALHSALLALRRGELAISRDLSSRFIETVSRWVRIRAGSMEPESELTARELEILKDVQNGLENHAIAEHLGISENTVKVHLNNIRQKLKLDSRKDLAEYSRRLWLKRRLT